MLNDMYTAKHPCINDLVYSYIYLTLLLYIQLVSIIISEVTRDGGVHNVFGKIFNIQCKNV